MPQGSVAHSDAEIAQNAFSQLRHGEVFLFANPSPQAPVMAFQAASAVTASLLGFQFSRALVLVPVSLHAAGRDPK